MYSNVRQEAFIRRERFEAKVRCQRADGQYRWMNSIGVPRFDTDGTFLALLVAPRISTIQWKQIGVRISFWPRSLTRSGRL